MTCPLPTGQSGDCGTRLGPGGLLCIGVWCVPDETMAVRIADQAQHDCVWPSVLRHILAFPFQIQNGACTDEARLRRGRCQDPLYQLRGQGFHSL